MKKYKVEITETLQRTEEVEAESYQEAVYKIEEKYKKEEIVLDWADFTNARFEISC